jgi:hypothetical protein
VCAVSRCAEFTSTGLAYRDDNAELVNIAAHPLTCTAINSFNSRSSHALYYLLMDSLTDVTLFDGNLFPGPETGRDV